MERVTWRRSGPSVGRHVPCRSPTYIYVDFLRRVVLLADKVLSSRGNTWRVGTPF